MSYADIVCPINRRFEAGSHDFAFRASLTSLGSLIWYFYVIRLHCLPDKSTIRSRIPSLTRPGSIILVLFLVLYADIASPTNWCFEIRSHVFIYTLYTFYSKCLVQLFCYCIPCHTLALLHRQFNDSKSCLMTLPAQFHSQWMGHLFGIVFGAVRWHCLPDKLTIRCLSHDFVYAVSLIRLCSTPLYRFQFRNLTYNQWVTFEISGTYNRESGIGEFNTQNIYWRQVGQRN